MKYTNKQSYMLYTILVSNAVKKFLSHKTKNYMSDQMLNNVY